MPWRDDTRPYYIVVSEIMLQQTQVHRVLAKFSTWIKRFPNWQTLADASTKEVLKEWSGLGYNRRALFLKRIAEIVISNKEYSFLLQTKPATKSNFSKTEHFNQQEYEKLTGLPGIGPNTAGSILAFAFNIPHPFIETNIRSVFIHHFFPDIEKKEGKKACKKISDAEIFPLIEKSLNAAIKKGYFKGNSREWYWALMDYGSYLKKNMPNPSRKSVHHVKQKAFKGSNRELRSKILKLIMKRSQTREMIEGQLKVGANIYANEQVEKNLDALVKEGFIIVKRKLYKIT